MKRARIALWALAGTTALAGSLLVGVYASAKAMLAPLPGEWSAPVRIGRLQFTVGVPSAIRLATAPWLGPLLDGRTLPTPAGPVRASWQAQEATLSLRCAPCTLSMPALGADPLQLAEVVLTVHRQGEQLSGMLASGQLHAGWRGDLSAQKLRLKLELPASQIADGYALFGAAVPELARAKIDGRFSLSAQLTLPGGALAVTPHVEGFAVSGLGTELLEDATSACSRRTSKLTASSWLARAVVAAEDQRFYEHSGYDLAELTSAFAHNQQAGGVTRGASTLSQQLAKLVVTGGERSATRKLRELLYAVEMEQTLGKARILTLYLQHAPWGDGLCGAEAASRKYFGRRAHELTPTQAAWLAAMLHNPALEAQRWAETGEINVERTQWVLSAMRGMPRAQRARLAAAATQTGWTAPPAPDHFSVRLPAPRR